jgi:hypothetical protein
MRRPMTEAEEKLIAAALSTGGPLRYAERDEQEAYYKALSAIERERMKQADLDAWIAAKEAYYVAYDRLKATRAFVPTCVQEEVCKERGWDTRHP